MNGEDLNRSLITAESSGSSTKSSALSALGNLVKLLPTGTVMVFEFLSPALTNNGQCKIINKILAAVLIGLSCAFDCFTDSYTDKHGRIHYGTVTTKGLWTFGGSSRGRGEEEEEGSSNYKLRFSDFVHMGLSVLVFAVLAILDASTVKRFFPSLISTENTLVSVLPVMVGAVSSVVFMLFPSSRHGIGYPPSGSSSSSESPSSGV